MCKKYYCGFVFLVCVLSVGLLLGSTVVAIADVVLDESENFSLIGTVDIANDGTKLNARAYSKIAPWPDTDGTTFNTGCYENDVNAGTIGCFRVVDVSDPANPVRIATVHPYDTVNSPRPPVPTDLYWVGKDAYNVWTNDTFDLGGTDELTFSTECGDWLPGGPGWAETEGKATCWDKGWITRTHFTAGVSGDYKPPQNDGSSTIYWVNSQRLRNSPSKRLGYTGVRFYDLYDPYNPELLGGIDMPVGEAWNYTTTTFLGYTNAGGVHHGFFDGRYAYLGASEDGFEGAHLVIVDAIDPSNPVIVGRWWIPGQKTPEEDDIRNSTDIDPRTKLQKGWIPQSGFSPVKRDPVTGLLYKGNTVHYLDVRRIHNKDIAFISWHQAGLIILDVTKKDKPKFLSRFDYLTPEFQAADTLPGAEEDHSLCVVINGPDSACGNAHSGKLVPGTDIFWITDEYFNLPYGHLRFFDVSNLRHPKLLSHMVLPETTDTTIDYNDRTGSTHLGNTWGKDLLFLAWYGLGVKAINFSDPKNPYEVGSYQWTANDEDGGMATYDVIFDSEGNLFVTDSEDGVRVLEYTGPGSPLVE